MLRLRIKKKLFLVLAPSVVFYFLCVPFKICELTHVLYSKDVVLCIRATINTYTFYFLLSRIQPADYVHDQVEAPYYLLVRLASWTVN
jgi:hypothetical protein